MRAGSRDGYRELRLEASIMSRTIGRGMSHSVIGVEACRKGHQHWTTYEEKVTGEEDTVLG